MGVTEGCPIFDLRSDDDEAETELEIDSAYRTERSLGRLERTAGATSDVDAEEDWRMHEYRNACKKADWWVQIMVMNEEGNREVLGLMMCCQFVEYT